MANEGNMPAGDQVNRYAVVHPAVTDQAQNGRSGVAWSDFCHRLEKVGHQLLSMRDIENSHDEAETMRYLVGELRVALEWEVQNADPQFPHFFREEACGSGPAGPNMDNAYWYARIDPGDIYRVTVDTSRIFDLVVTAYDTLLTNYGDYSLSQYAVGADGSLEVLVSAQEQPGNWLKMPAGADVVGLRIFYYDWDKDASPTPDIVRVGEEGAAPGRPDDAEMTRRLGAAIAMLETRPFRWTTLLNGLMDRLPDNSLAAVPVPGAAGPIQYGTGRCRLADDEALILEFEPPRARYWSINLYTVPWLSLIDPLHSVTGINGAQANVDPDGRVRIVVAHRDPGVPNWLATGGFEKASLWYRWIWSDNHPAIETRLTPFEQIRAHLHPKTAMVTADDRAAQISRRRRHLIKRYRF